MKSAKELQILWVDDDIKALQEHITSLENDGANVTTSNSTELGLYKIEENNFSVVISDLLLPPPSDAITFLKSIHKNYPETKLVVISGYLEIDEYRKSLSWLEKDMEIALIKKPLPPTDSEAFKKIKHKITGDLGLKEVTKVISGNIFKRIYDAMEMKVGFGGVKLDFKKLFSKSS